MAGLSAFNVTGQQMYMLMLHVLLTPLASTFRNSLHDTKKRTICASNADAILQSISYNHGGLHNESAFNH